MQKIKKKLIEEVGTYLTSIPISVLNLYEIANNDKSFMRVKMKQNNKLNTHSDRCGVNYKKISKLF